jgi:uncharacterized protein (DUF58 family)
VSQSATPKLTAYVTLATLGLLAALVFGRAGLAVLAAPFLAILAFGLVLARRPSIRVGLEQERERALVGDTVTLAIELESEVAVEALDVVVSLPPGLEPAGDDRNPFSTRLEARRGFRREIRVRCTRWGAFRLSPIVLRARDRLSLFVFEQTIETSAVLKVYPREEALRTLLYPRDTGLFAGDVVSRLKGEGVEFADLRPFVHGDQVRHVNWRATARRGELWVSELHPERNADVIVFLDTFAEAQRAGEGTLDQAVRAVFALARRYLARRDRVGIVSSGGVLEWVRPGSGVLQLYRIVDLLLDTEVVTSHARGDVSAIPPRILPPKALVVALSPLLDERAVAGLLDLRARGYDVVVVEVSPVPYVEVAQDEIGRLAGRLWMLERARLRALYLEAGVPIVEWREGAPLAAAIQGVSEFRRGGRHVRA